MKSFKKIIMLTIISLITCFSTVYATDENINTINEHETYTTSEDKYAKMSPLEEVASVNKNTTYIDETFINENKDFINDLVEMIMIPDSIGEIATDDEGYNAIIRERLVEKFGYLKEDGGETTTPQDELYDIINGLKNNGSEYMILSQYIQSLNANNKNSNPNDITEKIVILILFVLLIIAVAYILTDKLYLKNRKSSADEKLEKFYHKTELSIEDKDESYSEKYGIPSKRQQKIEDKVLKLEKEISVLRSEISEYKTEILKYQERCNELEDENDDLYRTKMILMNEDKQESQESNIKPERGKPKFTEANIVIENGQIQVVEGDYVMIKKDGNKLIIYPTERALELSVRRSLQNFFDFSGNGTKELILNSPCILEKDAQGYYNIYRKGNVYIS